MKKILFAIMLFISTNVYADVYYVEVAVKDYDNYKQGDQISSAKADKLPTGTDYSVIIELTKTEYEAISDGSTWKTDWTNWKKNIDNNLKITKAINTKVTDDAITTKIENKKKIMAIDELLKTATGTEKTALEAKKAELTGGL